MTILKSLDSFYTLPAIIISTGLVLLEIQSPVQGIRTKARAVDHLVSNHDALKGIRSA